MDRYKTTFQTYDKVTEVYQDKFMDMDLYNDTYDVFCQLIEKTNPAIFEIGCGPGNITRYLSRQRPDFRLEAVDVAPNMIRLAKANNPTASFQVMDCREIDLLNQQFDGIICGFCMPYLSKEECSELIKNCAQLLPVGGIFYFSVIEDDYSKSGYESGSTGDQVYVYYHEAPFLLDALEANHFEQKAVFRKAYSRADGTISTHLIVIAEKMG